MGEKRLHTFDIPESRGDEQGGLAGVLTGINVDTLGQEQLEHLARAAVRGEVERVLLLVISGARISAASEEKADHLQVGGFGGGTQAGVGGEVDVCALVKKQGNGGEVIGLDCAVQRVVLGVVDGGAGVDEESRGLRMPELDGKIQRRWW